MSTVDDKTSVKKIVASNARRIRKSVRPKISQEFIAEKLGCSTTTYQSFERPDDVWFEYGLLKSFCRYFNLEEHELFQLPRDEKPEEVSAIDAIKKLIDSQPALDPNLKKLLDVIPRDVAEKLHLLEPHDWDNIRADIEGIEERLANRKKREALALEEKAKKKA